MPPKFTMTAEERKDAIAVLKDMGESSNDSEIRAYVLGRRAVERRALVTTESAKKKKADEEAAAAEKKKKEDEEKKAADGARAEDSAYKLEVERLIAEDQALLAITFMSVRDATVTDGVVTVTLQERVTLTLTLILTLTLMLA